MTFFLALIAAMMLGVFAMPLGLLPGIMLFRNLADGTATDAQGEGRYALSVWGGLLLAWCAAAALVLWVLPIA